MVFFGDFLIGSRWTVSRLPGDNNPNDTNEDDCPDHTAKNDSNGGPVHASIWSTLAFIHVQDGYWIILKIAVLKKI